MCFARLRVLTALIACAAAVALPPSLVGGTLPANVTEGYVKAEDDIYLFARKIGSGPNVIIVPLQLFLYETFRSLAAADRTLIFYDVRNRGQSTPVGDDLKIGIQRDVADIDVIRQAFGVTRFSLIGFSYGGLMVALYAMDHPDR